MKLKVLVVDDSAFMRLLLSDILSEDSELEVVGSAADGKEAVCQVKQLQPDLVLLDMNMGEYDGLYAVEHIMQENPVPILILSAVGNSDLEPIFDALRHGAVDYMNKPVRNNSKLRSMDMELIRKIKSAARAKPTAHHPVIKSVKTAELKPRRKRAYDVIVIGASTGGPTAIENVITAFPGNLDVPVLIGQHMPANFIQPFVDRLNKLSPLNVMMGQKGMVPRPGTIIIAPGDRNMVVVHDKSTGQPTIGFTDEVFREYNNPSINALMLSVADIYGSKTLGAILTGMGKDGVKGLSAIKDRGGYTVSQDKATSVIYGMPKVAYDSGAVRDVLSIKEIGSFLVSKL